MSRNDAPRACIIGAGCSGFTTAKRLKDFGVPYDCFEMSDEIGGNWYYKNPNGLSACYESLHIDTSKWRLAFEDFPVPEGWPDFPHHAQLFQYFKDYVDHFGLRPTITFGTRVEKAERTDDGLWRVSLSTGERRLYDVLFVCNGHHWDTRTPDYPGTFDGAAFHSHAYCDPFDPVDMRGKNIVVVGMGNSAMDIASELAQRPIAANLWVAARRGVWVLPKYLNGKPADKAALPTWMPRKLGLSIARSMIKRAIGTMEDYGLPRPDHEPLEAHPSVSGEFLTRAGCGDIKFKPNIKALEGRRVRFEDDSVEEVDAIIYATGYKISFPFFDDPDLSPDAEHRFPLFKRMMKPEVPNLFFMGLAQPLPTLVNFAEQQAKLAAAYLTGRYRPPSPAEMARITRRDEAFHLGPYYKAARHTIQVDFAHYCADLAKEIALGARRAAKAGNALPVPALADRRAVASLAAE
ncbi:monooxygenase [Caulobacter sp. CCUG 60055]|uniref:flavin-containing monooxygenase n=1 Tax=Caulobacter sp. CCUG 60055 TaxID=2100090 RepID=UPI0003C1A24F|nr:NAD(P)-binding domain-containing protein [Caulobacter sp. CCUG 60055]MBQ1541791.1 NAD(P)-binding domain-containing protein [Caulobacteraceae bacterium]MCI3181825.1 monooxygenase [Caulobacter sp. CCUG 60055]